MPGPIASLCAELAAIAGVEAVTIGGSRATGMADAASDWDIGVYYRDRIDLTSLARHGEMHPPGAWGRIMNGGAWLTLDGIKADVLLRDVDVAGHWTNEARRGVYEVDALLGYLAGVPTYSLTAEIAINRTLHGALPRVDEFPPALAAAGARRWTFHADFSLTHAGMRAARGDITGAVGQASKAVLELAHAIACHRRQWILNEKHLIQQIDLAPIHDHFTTLPRSRGDLASWLSALTATLNTFRP